MGKNAPGAADAGALSDAGLCVLNPVGLMDALVPSPQPSPQGEGALGPVLDRPGKLRFESRQWLITLSLGRGLG
jgi:hypothetical protein